MEFGLIFLLALLFVSLSYVLVFHIREGRDERGKQILSIAYSTAYFVLIAGFVLTLFLDWSQPFGGISMKDIAVLMMCLSGISAAVMIAVLGRKY